MKPKDFITADVMAKREASGHAVHLYPRKHIVSIDGYKRYKVNAATVARWQYYKKINYLIVD